MVFCTAHLDLVLSEAALTTNMPLHSMKRARWCCLHRANKTPLPCLPLISPSPLSPLKRQTRWAKVLFFTFSTLSPWQVQSLVIRAKMKHFSLISLPSAMATAFCAPSKLSFQGNHTLALSLYRPLVLLAFVIWIPGLLLTAESRVMSLMLATYRKICQGTLRCFALCVQICCCTVNWKISYLQ